MEGTQDDMTATRERIELELHPGHQRYIRGTQERIAQSDVSRLLARMNSCGHGWVTCWRCLGAKKN